MKLNLSRRQVAALYVLTQRRQAEDSYVWTAIMVLFALVVMVIAAFGLFFATFALALLPLFLTPYGATNNAAPPPVVTVVLTVTPTSLPLPTLTPTPSPEPTADVAATALALTALVPTATSTKPPDPTPDLLPTLVAEPPTATPTALSPTLAPDEIPTETAAALPTPFPTETPIPTATPLPAVPPAATPISEPIDTATAMPTPLPMESNYGIIFGEPVSLETGASATVGLLVTNTSDQVKTFTLEATYKLGDNIVATAVGSVNDLAAGQTRAVVLTSQDAIPSQFDAVRVDVDTMLVESQSTPGAEVASKIAFGIPLVRDEGNFTTVDVEVTNNDSVAHAFTVQSIFTQGGRLTAIGTGSVNEIAPGQTKTATLIVQGVTEGAELDLAVTTVIQ